MRPLILIAALFAAPASAETVFAAHTIRAQSILTAQDIMIKDVDVPGAATRPEQIIGKESRVALYAGRPIRQGDVGPPAVVDRNQIVPLIFKSSGLTITAEGRALQRAGAGEYVRVMNLASRNTVTGLVLADGRVMVSQ
ncbi:flagellar basal body P-ring formation chaperone FlgA [Roseovarius sp. 2305UL8-3]|uniref:flagellar basal body P-ring formation chaperone FlgA n=1 Tax=Roseovarius conchicola TaxID=3121636 RepID=UPI00352879F0